LRAARIWCLVVMVGLAGCGGGGSDSAPPDTAQTGSDDEDLTKRWGPDVMPDQDTEPLQFLYWRVDSLFDRSDLDADGRLTRDEYPGEAFNFERIDANDDGVVTKKEIIDDMAPRLREEGKIP
jgi:hypothetical protein